MTRAPPASLSPPPSPSPCPRRPLAPPSQHDHPNRDNQTDPRVVENAQGLKPYQLEGVKANKVMLRLLDPSVALRQVVDPFGHDEPGNVLQLKPLSPELLQQALSRGHAPWDFEKVCVWGGEVWATREGGT